jgi:hypothetical protein
MRKAKGRSCNYGTGPIINAMAPDFIGEQPLALKWTAFEPGNMFQRYTR